MRWRQTRQHFYYNMLTTRDSSQRLAKLIQGLDRYSEWFKNTSIYAAVYICRKVMHGIHYQEVWDFVLKIPQLDNISYLGENVY